MNIRRSAFIRHKVTGGERSIVIKMAYITCGLEEFINRYSGKSMMCFGSGSYFQIMRQDFLQRGVKTDIACVIDNDVKKAGLELDWQGKRVRILPLTEALETFGGKGMPLLITSASHAQILEQLSHTPKCREMPIYSYFDLKEKDTPEYSKLCGTTKERQIPKVIHYCWFGGRKKPEHLQRCIDSWSRFCPDYAIVEWNESNCDLEENFFVRKALEQRKWGFIPDYFRLRIIYDNGGVYLDTDVELVQSLDPLLCNKAFFCTEVTGGINEGSGFGAKKGDPLVGRLKEIYQELKEWDPFLFNTSLGKEIGVFHHYGYSNNGKFQTLKDKTAVYPYQVMAPYIKETDRISRTEATVGIHHFDGSWC